MKCSYTNENRSCGPILCACAGPAGNVQLSCAGRRVRYDRRHQPTCARPGRGPLHSAWVTSFVVVLTLGLPSGPAAAGTYSLSLGWTHKIEPLASEAPHSFPRRARAGRQRPEDNRRISCWGWTTTASRAGGGQHPATVIIRLRGGSAPWLPPYGAGEHDAAAQQWGREFDRLGAPPTPSRRFAAEPHEDEAEALFRHAFFLTHYRLNFVHARQLLERVLALNPRHVPALTTLVLLPTFH